MAVEGSLSFSGLSPAEMQSISAAAAAALSGASGTAQSSVPAVDYFPADPAKAPFPSPDGSRVTATGGVLGGEPYIVDKSGAYYNFGPKPVAAPRSPNVYADGCYHIFINGVQSAFAGDMIVIWQGVMWMHQGGKWFYVSGNGGTAGDLAQLPSSSPTGGSGPSASAATGAFPTPAATVPGSSGTIIPCGPKAVQTTLAKALAASAAGGTITLDPTATFNESVALTTPLKLIGGGSIGAIGTAQAAFAGGAKIDGTGLADPTAYAHKLGGLVPMTDCDLDGLEISGFGLQETSAGGTGGDRVGAPAYVRARRLYVHDNQDGLFSGTFPCVWDIADSLLENNGLGDGYTHNMYFTTGTVAVSLSNVTSLVPPKSAASNRKTGMMNGGHAFKSRALYNAIFGGYYYASDATPIDIPDGTAAIMFVVGATIVKKAGDANHGFFGYCMESRANGTAGVIFLDCTFDLQCAGPLLQAKAGVIVFGSGNTWLGNKPAMDKSFSSTATVIGLPT